jgi:tRNA-splicing ligase RtcB
VQYQGYEVRRVHPALVEIPRQRRMRVPARIYATEGLFEGIVRDQAIQQVINVAELPGIVGYSLAMPDIHWGYGFPIGGVAAFDLETGVISPGGVGYDINCGVRLLASRLKKRDVSGHMESIAAAMYRNVPTGVGKGGKLVLKTHELRQVLARGAKWAVKKGYGRKQDLDHVEEGGRIDGAEPELVSERAVERGRKQLGTLGSGNHFAEVGYVDKVFDGKLAARLGLAEGTVTVIIHTGSRGCGHQVCTDTLKDMQRAVKRYGIELPDRQLAAAPLNSPEGRAYLGAMRAAINFAFANRQVITHWIREAFREALGVKDGEVGLRVVYEVAHNIAKVEEHEFEGRRVKVCVHRKGATRAFGPGHPDVPSDYRDIGQPVLIPGDMGRYSFVLVGTEGAMRETWGSTCHGAGRQMSRRQAKREAKGRELRQEMTDRGVVVRAASYGTIAEEMPEAYKDVAEVVRAVERAGISKIVARLRPLGVIKG